MNLWFLCIITFLITKPLYAQQIEIHCSKSLEKYQCECIQDFAKLKGWQGNYQREHSGERYYNGHMVNVYQYECKSAIDYIAQSYSGSGCSMNAHFARIAWNGYTIFDYTKPIDDFWIYCY